MFFSMKSDCLEHWLTNFFCKEAEMKYFRFRGPYLPSMSQLLESVIVVPKYPQTMYK